MKNLITSILILISVLGFSQEKYDLLLDKDRAVTFNQSNSLERACQIYNYEQVDSVSFVIYNDYLRFEFKIDSISLTETENIIGSCKVSFGGFDDGTYKATVNKMDRHWYIIKFIQSEEICHYYYFYRRWDFLEPYWPEHERVIIDVSIVPPTVSDSN
jgi:hypothetical protein